MWMMRGGKEAALNALRVAKTRPSGLEPYFQRLFFWALVQ